MPDMNIIAMIDRTADAAYIRLCEGDVVRTVAVTDEVHLDLDAYDMALGVEVLDLDAELPLQVLVADYHVPVAAIDALRSIRPTISGFFQVGQAADGALVTNGFRQPVRI